MFDESIPWIWIFYLSQKVINGFLKTTVVRALPLSTSVFMHTISATSHFNLWLVALDMLFVLAFIFSMSHEFRNFFHKLTTRTYLSFFKLSLKHPFFRLQLLSWFFSTYFVLFNSVSKIFRVEIFLGFHYLSVLSHKKKQSKARLYSLNSLCHFSYSISGTLLLSCWLVTTPSSLQTPCLRCLLHCCILYFFLQCMQFYITSTGNASLKIFMPFSLFYFS